MNHLYPGNKSFNPENEAFISGKMNHLIRKMNYLSPEK
jgi:hypothetical protein